MPLFLQPWNHWLGRLAVPDTPVPLHDAFNDQCIKCFIRRSSSRRIKVSAIAHTPDSIGGCEPAHRIGISPGFSELGGACLGRRGLDFSCLGYRRPELSYPGRRGMGLSCLGRQDFSMHRRNTAGKYRTEQYRCYDSTTSHYSSSV